MKKSKTILLLNKYLIFLAIISICYALFYTKIIEHKSIYEGNEEEFLCTIKKYSIDGDKLSLDLKCDENLKANYYFKTKEEKERISEKIEYDLKIKALGKLEVPSNNTIFNLFNYKKYLINNNIYYLLSINNFEIISKTNNPFYKIKNILHSRSSKTNNEYIDTFIMGDSTQLEKTKINSFRENGISHLLALSGLHVSLFSTILFYCLKKIKINSISSTIIVFIFLLLFAFISGFSPSIIRSILFFFISSINKKYNLDLKTNNILYLVFSTMIFINPFYIYNTGFILSFITTFFLIITIKEEKKSYFKGLLKMSLIAYLSSLGISIYIFGSTNIISPVLNLIFVPFVSFILFPLSVLSYLFNIFIYILKPISIIFEYLNFFFNRINVIIYFPKIRLIYVIIYYLLLLLFFKRNKVIYFALICFLLLFLKLTPFLDSNAYVYFLDVGQGDSIVLVMPHLKKVVMIDTGGKITYQKDEWKTRKKTYGIAKDSLIPFLRSIGINKINYLLSSHGDYDHMGEAINLVNNFKVEKVIFNCGPYNELEKELIKVLDKKNIKYYSCIKELNIDKNKLYFLQTKEYDNENDNSNVIYTELNGYKFMFMGDASSTTEKEILNKYNLPDIDVLKVGHHGSKTSSSKVFIDEINPKYSIISVGKNNRYGHPNKEVLDNLDNSNIYRTDEDGSIMFKIKNNKLKVETCTP